MRLSTAIALAVLTGVVLAAVAEWVLFVAFHPQRGGTPVDVTKLALTVVCGVHLPYQHPNSWSSRS